MYVKIKGKKGRLGNIIIQIINAIIYAKVYEMNFRFDLKKNFLKKKDIILFPNKKEDKYYYDKKTDFRNLNFVKNGKQYDTNYRKIKFYEFIRQELMDIFTIKRSSIVNLPKKTLIIYIRSGDLFPLTGNKVHPAYISAPYYYYDYILKKYKNKYNKYILVAEDDNNPVIKKLLKNYPNILWKKNDLLTDLKIILGASHIVSCVGTFISSLSWINPNMRKIYLPCFVGKRRYYPKLEFEKIELPNFKKKMGKWSNSEKQKKLLIDYKPN